MKEQIPHEYFFEETDGIVKLFVAEVKHGIADNSTKRLAREATATEIGAYRAGEHAGVKAAANRIKKHLDEITLKK